MISRSYGQLKKSLLKEFWGYDSFRDLQEEIIDSLVRGNDTLALLPTGAGKSLCYQLPALLLEGTALIVSPLLALMRDQVHQLRERGIEAEYLSHELEDHETDQILYRCKEGITSLLFVSPERLQSSQFLAQIADIHISFLAVDEAHCVSDWGQDFRPSYRHIKAFREEFLSVPLLALTATATPRVLQEILNTLGLKKPKIFQQSFRRENLSLAYEETENKFERICEILRVHHSSGLIYVRSRKDTQRLAEYLRSRGFSRVDYYHAGLRPSEKRQKQHRWLKSQSEVLITTNAFGMGIDKPDVRFIVHFNTPTSIENYYQEIGRAGRDSGQSLALTLYNEKEFENFDRVLSHQIPSKTEFKRITTVLYSIYQIAETELVEKTFVLDLEKIVRLCGSSPSKLRSVLNFLHQHEVIFYGDYEAPSTLRLHFNVEDLELLGSPDAHLVENLLRSLPGLVRERVFFSETALCKKIGIQRKELKEKFKELEKKELVTYIDGSLPTVRFLKPRNSRTLNGEYQKLYFHLQKTKIQKWEEIKYFIREKNTCKTSLILRYFGENPGKDCGQCTNCKRSNSQLFENKVEEDLLLVLGKSPQTLEGLSAHLGFYTKRELQEALIELLNAGLIEMQDFRTYRKT